MLRYHVFNLLSMVKKKTTNIDLSACTILCAYGDEQSMYKRFNIELGPTTGWQPMNTINLSVKKSVRGERLPIGFRCTYMAPRKRSKCDLNLPDMRDSNHYSKCSTIRNGVGTCVEASLSNVNRLTFRRNPDLAHAHCSRARRLGNL